MLINGQLVAGEGPAWTVLDPARAPPWRRSTKPPKPRSAPCAPPTGVRQLVADRAERAFAAAGNWPTPSKPTARSWPSWNRTTAASPSAALNDEIPAIADVFRFFAGASRCLSGSAAANTCPATPR
jgi:aminobutyraldehyde dehydrogenase